MDGAAGAEGVTGAEGAVGALLADEAAMSAVRAAARISRRDMVDTGYIIPGVTEIFRADEAAKWLVALVALLAFGSMIACELRRLARKLRGLPPPDDDLFAEEARAMRDLERRR
jgi:hypothetical protein